MTEGVLPPLGRAHVVHPVRLRVEVHLADEGRHERDRHQHEEPRRVHEEPRPEAHDRDHVLRLVEELAHEPRAPRGLVARALEPVLQLAILEVLQVECRRVLHQPKARRDAEALAEHPHDRIDDERADVERCHRQKRADEAQHDERDTDRGTRLPDELQEGREISEGADALADRVCPLSTVWVAFTTWTMPITASTAAAWSAS